MCVINHATKAAYRIICRYEYSRTAHH